MARSGASSPGVSNSARPTSSFVGVEAQHMPPTDQRYVPVAPVGVHRRVVRSGVGVEAQLRHLNGRHHLPRLRVDHRHARRGLVRHVDALGWRLLRADRTGLLRLQRGCPDPGESHTGGHPRDCSHLHLRYSRCGSSLQAATHRAPGRSRRRPGAGTPPGGPLLPCSSGGADRSPRARSGRDRPRAAPPDPGLAPAWGSGGLSRAGPCSKRGLSAYPRRTRARPVPTRDLFATVGATLPSSMPS